MSEWNNRCKMACYLMSRINPGPEWYYSGQYGRDSACSDAWVKLVRKQGDRVFVQYADTDHRSESNPAPDPRFALTTGIKCSTQDFWTDKNG